MTQFTHVHKKRLLKLADFLENELPPQKFCFAVIVDGDDTPRKTFDCGSTACGIGWCPVVFPRLAKYDYESSIGIVVVPADGSMDSYEETSVEATARSLFGLTGKETGALFDPMLACFGREMGLTPLGGNASAKELAKNIRLFLKYKEKQLAK